MMGILPGVVTVVFAYMVCSVRRVQLNVDVRARIGPGRYRLSSVFFRIGRGSRRPMLSYLHQIHVCPETLDVKRR
jgi:hypothetical protein